MIYHKFSHDAASYKLSGKKRSSHVGSWVDSRGGQSTDPKILTPKAPIMTAADDIH